MQRSRLLCLALVVSACGGSAGTTTSAGPGTTATATTTTVAAGGILEDGPGLTGVQAELAALRLANDGLLPADAALDFFAATFGPVPGADPGRFAARPGDGTLAMMEALAHWAEFTPEQQQAIRVLLGYPGVQSLRSVAFVPDPALQGQIDSARAALATRVGSDVPFPIVADRRELGVTDEGESILGIAIAEIGGDLAIVGSLDRCVVAFPPEEDPSPPTVAHEVFHCFQYHLAGDVAAIYGGEKWIVEGSAEWAGAEVAGVDATVEANFVDWIVNDTSIFGLDYAAVGFYWVVESMGVDPAPLVGEMLQARGTAAIAVLGLDPGEVLNRISTSIARRDTAPAIPEIAALWDFADPQVPFGGIRVPRTVAEGEEVSLEGAGSGYVHARPVVFTLEGGTRVQVHVDSDVGTAQFYDKDPIPWSDSLVREFCLEPGGCRCGVDGEVDPGLGEGSRTLIVAGGEAGAGPVSYTVRIPRSDGGFTDGVWTGEITTTSLIVSGDGVTSERSSDSGAVEIVVENGAVTSGSFAFGFFGSFESEAGSGSGTITITGVFTGCGFSPQMQGTRFDFAGVFLIDGTSVPVEFGFDMSPSAGTTTFWVPDAVSEASLRTGAIDASAYLGAIASSGLSAHGMEISYSISRTG